jgi:hypothetical protein
MRNPYLTGVTGEYVGNNTEDERVVIPIERGRIIKTQHRETRETARPPESTAMRRLRQCVEMLAELTRDVANTQ